MKVIYKPTIYDRIMDAIRYAKKDDLMIDYIEVDKQEYSQLRRRLTHQYCVSTPDHRSVMFAGVEIRLEEEW